MSFSSVLVDKRLRIKAFVTRRLDKVLKLCPLCKVIN